MMLQNGSVSLLKRTFLVLVWGKERRSFLGRRFLVLVKNHGKASDE